MKIPLLVTKESNFNLKVKQHLNEKSQSKSNGKDEFEYQDLSKLVLILRLFPRSELQNTDQSQRHFKF